MTAKAVAESWKYTNLAPIEAVAWGAPVRAAMPEVAETPFPICGRVVFHNGFFVESVSFLPSGVHFTRNLHRHDFPEDSRIAEMNAAHRQDGVALKVIPGVALAPPLEILFLSEGETPVRLAPFLFIDCGEETSLSLIERHEGAGCVLGNVRVGIGLDSGARLDHIRLQNTAGEANILESLELSIGKGASCHSFLYSDGAALSRCQITATLAGPEAEFNLNSIMLARGQKVMDLTTLLRHAAPRARSSQQVRTVLDGPACGVYQGKIVVDRGADGTDARQQSRALLLSEGAEMDTKPELEILADDVKCTHGAATGAIDPLALFYLRTRSIPEKEARALLVRAFVAELSETLPSGAVREAVEARIARWMETE